MWWQLLLCEQLLGRRQTCYSAHGEFAVVVPNWRQQDSQWTQRCELDLRISTRKRTMWHLDSILWVRVRRPWRRWLSLMCEFHLFIHVQANAYLPPGCLRPFRDWYTRGFVLSVKQGPTFRLSGKKAKTVQRGYIHKPTCMLPLLRLVRRLRNKYTKTRGTKTEASFWSIHKIVLAKACQAKACPTYSRN